VLEGFLSLSLRNPNGIVFHSITSGAAVRGALNVVIYQKGQKEQVAARNTPDDGSNELQVEAQEAKGFVLFRAYASQTSDRINAEQQILSFRCDVDQ
jgi:uncharacterized membrane protein